jgi:hypothetical protein
VQFEIFSTFYTVHFSQLRIDFSNFVIAGPSTITTTALSETNGVIVAVGKGATVSTATQCLTDTFSVTGPGIDFTKLRFGRNVSGQFYIL